MARRRSPLLDLQLYLRRGPRLNGGFTEESPRGRDWEDLYRERWRHDKVVRSTHGVNCTGSCSWKIHVKDGVITWETQQTDYPSLGRDVPEYEPRGCARGASFSWYEYSPLRVRYPYVRASLIGPWRARRAELGDPVAAWRAIASDPQAQGLYKSQRGKGGFVRASWDEVAELIAAASVDTIQRYGPDRVVGFSPIPAMSMVSYASGARFLSLIGGTILSFYDWYADLPIASPQIWGEQTDVPESADWYNADYMLVWGSNLPMTRTPDAHFLSEARYRGTRVAAVSPDYAEYVKFADVWLAVRPGSDGALAMAMTYVILKEFYIEHQTPYFQDYAQRFTDLPHLVVLEPKGDVHVSGRFLRAEEIGLDEAGGRWRTLVWDRSRGPAAPNGSLGDRWARSGRWNLRLEDGSGELEPLLSLQGVRDGELEVDFPYFGGGQGESVRRGVPVRRVRLGTGEEVAVTTVFDLLLAQVGVARGLAGDYPTGLDDERSCTPAWQEALTGVPRETCQQVAREFAETAARTRGRAMIAMGAGINHWYHSDATYRAIINLVLLTGCQGVQGGGWAHYVGQEKVRPIEGFSTVAFAADWLPLTRQQNATSFFYFATDQFRHDDLDRSQLGWPGGGRFTAMHPADVNALAARLGWLPSYPQFTQNPLDVAAEARAAGAADDHAVAAAVAGRLSRRELQLAIEQPDAPASFPRVMFLWRANLLGSSSKGHEHFLRHLLGADGHVLGDEARANRPESIACDGEAPSGKLDLLVDIDFRMTGSGLYADIVLPAATWYEKWDLSSTDMHPFVHPFNPAISPPWEAKSDWDAFLKIAETFSHLSRQHLGVREDVVMAPLLHDSPQELAQPFGKVRDWRAGEVEPVPGVTMPRFVLVSRDYPATYSHMVTLGPGAEEAIRAKGMAVPSREAYEALREALGPSGEPGEAGGRPSLRDQRAVADAILRLSGATCGERAVASWRALEAPTGLSLQEVAQGRRDEVMTHKDLTAQPRLAIASPAWSGLEGEGRRYAPYTANVELLIPWRTLTGRQHFYLDHEMMLDFGEGLPVYRPPLTMPAPPAAQARGAEVTLRYLTPHGKWGIHSTYGDTLPMLTLFRGGPTVWLSPVDAARIGVRDNDWVEAYNRSGVFVGRAVVSHRIPQGTSFVYHAQDRTVGVPAAAITGDRGGTHNSLTQILPKATHMIGGYAQLSYGFNYYGPTGHQRDEMAVLRRLGEVRWLEG